MEFIYIQTLTLISLLGADCFSLKDTHDYVDDGFIPLWRQITYKEIVNIDNTLYLKVIDSNIDAQYLFKINIDKNLYVIQNHLTGTVYVAYFIPTTNQQLSVARLYLDSSKTKYVIKNLISRTKWSVLTGDGKGGVSFKDYNPAAGVQSVTITGDKGFRVFTDSFGNQVIKIDFNLESYFYPIHNDSNTNFPIVFDELVGDGLLIDSSNNLYNLEFDMHGNFKAINIKNGKKSYVSVSKVGAVVFSSNPFPPTPPVKLVEIKNTICKNLPKQAVKTKFEQSIEVDSKGNSFLRSDDTFRNYTFRTPIEKLDNIPVVYDFMTTYAYLVNEKHITQLFKNGNNYVIKDNSFKTGTGYRTVTADQNNKLKFVQFNPNINITRTIDTVISPAGNKNQLLVLVYSGENGNLPEIFLDSIITKDAMHNFPLLHNQLTCETMLVVRSTATLYRLEKTESKDYVAVDGNNWVRRKFKVQPNGDVDIIFE